MGKMSHPDTNLLESNDIHIFTSADNNTIQQIRVKNIDI